jgi:hypothetical protein
MKKIEAINKMKIKQKAESEIMFWRLPKLKLGKYSIMYVPSEI